MRCLLSISALLFSHCCLAQELVVTLRSKVTSEQQQPRVMIWCLAAAGRAVSTTRCEAGLAEELFTEVDRDEFRRDLEYRVAGDNSSATAARAPRAMQQ